MKHMGVGGIHFPGRSRFERAYRDATAALALAEQHATKLRGHGWTEVESQALARDLERMRTLRSELTLQRAAASEATKELRAIEREIAAFRWRIDRALCLAKLQGRTDLDLSAFKWKMMNHGYLKWSLEIRASVAKVDNLLRGRLWAGSPLDDLDALILRYQRMVGAREVHRRPLPQKTAEARACRMRIHQKLRELTLSAELAFDGDAKLVNAFRFGASEPADLLQAA